MTEPASTPHIAGNSVRTHRLGTSLFSLHPAEMESFFPSGISAHDVPNDQRLPANLNDSQAWRHQIEKLRPDVIVSGWSTPKLPPELSATRGGPVRYICNVTGSVRHVVTRELIEEGLWVTNWGQLVAPMVAEHALLLTIACLRNLARWPEVMAGRNSPPKSTLQTRTLQGKRVALHGFGAISQALVLLLRPFNCEIVAYSEGMPANHFEERGVRRAPSLVDLCQDAEIFISCEALTPRTRGELNGTMLQRLAEGAVFVNVGRGAVVNEADLNRVVHARQLRVGLDVFCHEPLPLDSPLRTLPGVLISPHIGGPTHDAYRLCGQNALQNLEAYRLGQEPQGLFSPALFDRST